MAVSGGYGASASGTTDANGYFAVPIKPINVGGPFPISFAVTSASGNLNITSTSITVVKNLTPTLVLQAIGSPSAVTSQPFNLSATLNDQFGNPLNGTSIKLAASTDLTATLANVFPSGPSGSSTGSLTQTSGTYSSGSVAIGVVSDKTGSQTISATATVNSQTVTAQYNVFVQSNDSILASIAWGSISTNVSAGSTLTVSGQALDIYGNSIPNKSLQIYFKEGGAIVQTVLTDSNGRFSVNLVPTVSGIKTLVGQMGSSIYQYSSSITVAPGTFSVGTITTNSGPFYTGDSVSVTIKAMDTYNNPISNIQFTLSVSGTGAPSVTQPLKTDTNGQTTVNEGPFNNSGTFTITATANGVTLQTSVAINAPVPASITITDNNSYTYAYMRVEVQTGYGYPYPISAWYLVYKDGLWPYWHNSGSRYLYYTVTVKDNRGRAIPNTQINLSLSNLSAFSSGINNLSLGSVQMGINGVNVGYCTTSSFYPNGVAALTTDTNGQIGITLSFDNITGSDTNGGYGEIGYSGVFKAVSAIAPTVWVQESFASTNQF